MNTLELRHVAEDFQVEKYFPERNFFLALIKDKENGYLYDGTIVSTENNLSANFTADTINKFLNDYKSGNLHAYLKTEKRDPEPFYVGNILRVYGSNFIPLVKELKYAPKEDVKGLILMFTKQNCPKCDWTEAYFDRLAQEFGGEDF